jgi:hypothetical protein
MIATQQVGATTRIPSTIDVLSITTVTTVFTASKNRLSNYSRRIYLTFNESL